MPRDERLPGTEATDRRRALRNLGALAATARANSRTRRGPENVVLVRVALAAGRPLPRSAMGIRDARHAGRRANVADTVPGRRARRDGHGRELFDDSRS